MPGKSQSYEEVRTRLIAMPEVQRGQLSWSFRDVQTGQELDAFQEQKLMTPASIQKLFATAFILQDRGIEFQFKTIVAYSGKRHKEKLEGNLVVRGDGDPSLGSGLAGAMSGDSVLAVIYHMLKDSGISRIEGDLVIDPFKWPYDERVIPRNWIWEDLGNYYGSGSWGLNWRNNEFSVKISSNPQNEDSAMVEILSPWAKHLNIRHHIGNPRNGEQEVYFYSAPFGTEILASGTYLQNKQAFIERASLPNPPLAFGLELKQFLASKGISISGEIRIRDTRNESLRSLGLIYSPMLNQLIFETNQKSNNLFAECLTKEMSMRVNASDENPNGKYLQDRLLSFRSYRELGLGLRFVDGSGLSRSNAITTELMSEFLRNTTSLTRFPYYMESLPKAGEEGTMKSFPKIDQLRAKSGSMAGVRSYAGYFFDKNNHWIAFAIIANNIPLEGKELKSAMADLIQKASETSFELPLQHVGPAMFGDTLNQLPSLKRINEQLKEEYGKEPELQAGIPNPTYRIRYLGEPSLKNPYYYIAIDLPYKIGISLPKLRFHAKTRRLEEFDNQDNEWKTVPWESFLTKQ